MGTLNVTGGQIDFTANHFLGVAGGQGQIIPAAVGSPSTTCTWDRRHREQCLDDHWRNECCDGRPYHGRGSRLKDFLTMSGGVLAVTNATVNGSCVIGAAGSGTFTMDGGSFYGNNLDLAWTRMG